MKNTRKIFAIIMAMIMCFSMLSVTAFATDEMITVYFDNGNSNWEMIITIYETADGMRTSAGQMNLEGGDLYSVSIPADTVLVRFQNYLPGQPEEYAPVEGFQSIEFTDLEDGRVYTYEDADTDDYVLWVGGVQVTEDNADDILGDGTASYNAEENILYLDGLNITTGFMPNEYSIAGIYTEGDLTIELAEGSENTVDIPGNGMAYGIGVGGALYITGDGNLTITIGEYNGEYADSYGIFARYELCIEQANVATYGGDVTSTENGVNTAGVYTQGDISIDFGGSLTAVGGDATGEYTYSDGICVYGIGGIIYSSDSDESYYRNIAVYDGYLDVRGGNTTSNDSSMSTGMYLYNAGFYVYENTANVYIEAGDATTTSTDEEDDPRAESHGIYVIYGDVGIDAGNVTVSAGECTGLKTMSCGIITYAYEDEDGSFSGGYVNIDCDEVTPSEYTPSLIGTTVNISANDYAIIGEMGIEIGDKLAITEPENAEIGQFDDFYTLLNADGSVANNTTIEPLTYKVTINGLNNGMAANVPVGQSLNETYCEKYGVDDFSEIFNTEKDGYTFGGFYTDEACTDGNEFDFDNPITEDITIYAKWIKDAEDNTQQGGTNTDNNENQNTPDNEDNNKPVADPEIPNTDATVSNAWFTILLASAFGVVLIMNSYKKRVFSK